jgi:hypothetical protein
MFRHTLPWPLTSFRIVARAQQARPQRGFGTRPSQSLVLRNGVLGKFVVAQFFAHPCLNFVGLTLGNF